MQGWIKLHRQFLEWEWSNDSNMVHLFIYLILNANHKDKKWKGVTIKKGQLISGINSLNKNTSISIQSIRTCLERLKSTCEITIKSTNKYSIITIVNWELYQYEEDEVTSKSTGKLTNKQQTTNKQLTTNNNENNEKNVKELKLIKNLVYLKTKEIITNQQIKTWLKYQNFNFIKKTIENANFKTMKDFKALLTYAFCNNKDIINIDYVELNKVEEIEPVEDIKNIIGNVVNFVS